MFKTNYPEVNKLLDELLTKLQCILGDKLIGLYLYGSLVTGDFDIKVSDIDLLAVLDSEISQEDFEKLRTLHENFSQVHPEWDNRIEVVYMSKVALQTFKEKSSQVAVISPGEPFHTKDVGKHWLMNWYIVREQGLTLYGEYPKTIIAPVSKEEFIQSVKEHTKSWNDWVKNMKSLYAQAYAILTLCRAYYSVNHGLQTSKVKAAHWTGEQLPEWKDLIEDALNWRKMGSHDSAIDEQHYPKTVEFVKIIRSKVLET